MSDQDPLISKSWDLKDNLLRYYRATSDLFAAAADSKRQNLPQKAKAYLDEVDGLEDVIGETHKQLLEILPKLPEKFRALPEPPAQLVSHRKQRKQQRRQDQQYGQQQNE